jgi:hypothetical protein
MSISDMESLHQRIEVLERGLSRATFGVSALAVLVVALLVAGWIPTQHARFAVLDVERINVREPDGTLAVVVANQNRMRGNIIDGLVYSIREGVSGLIFYNSEGDEAGV